MELLFHPTCRALQKSSSLNLTSMTNRRMSAFPPEVSLKIRIPLEDEMGKVRSISVLLAGDMAGRGTEKQFSGLKVKSVLVLTWPGAN